MLNTPTRLAESLSRVAAGDRKAFEHVYRATSAKLYGIVLRILRRRELADEVMQDVYLSIWQRARDFDADRASPVTWMATIARNRAIDVVRKRSEAPALTASPDLPDMPDGSPIASELMEHREDYARLLKCLDALSPERQQVVKLAYLDGLSREELALRFGHPVATIKTWLHRSCKQLKDCLS